MKQGKASVTAVVVAGGVLFTHHEPDVGHLVSNEAAEAILRLLKARSPVGAVVFAHAVRYSWSRQLLRAVEEKFLAGIMLHHAVRKRYIEDQTRQALAQRAEQVVVLGAGLDTLALRLHREFPRTMFVELDHPATQDAKRRVYGALTPPPGKNLHLLPADFTHESADQVLAYCPGYDRTAVTVLIMEGVLMYLTAADVDRAFAAVRASCGAGSRFLFTFMELGDDGRPGFHQRVPSGDLWLARKGEPFLWGMRPEETGAFVKERGFRLRELPSADDLRSLYLSGIAGDRRLAEGERICVSERL